MIFFSSTFSKIIWFINRPLNQRCLKNWADVADKICFSRTIKFAIGIEFAAVETPIKMESRSSIVPYWMPPKFPPILLFRPTHLLNYKKFSNSIFIQSYIFINFSENSPSIILFGISFIRNSRVVIIWSFGLCWPLLAFVGLCWPLLASLAFVNFLSENWPLLIKIKHNGPVSNNKMSKSISESHRAF